jgi:transcriptional regulator GlxA family with amidase domain
VGFSRHDPGIDLALAWIEQNAGREIAISVARLLMVI